MTQKMTASSTPFNPSTLFAKPLDAAITAPAVPAEVALCEALPHNQALIRFVMQHQPISAGALFASYNDVGDSLELFTKRLTYLRDKRWLLKDGEGRSAVYRFNTERTSRPVKVCAAAPAPKPAPDPARLAAPARRNVMAGTYQPASEAVRRAGSDDFTRLPSLRQGRCVPFVPGYIFY